MASPKHEDIQVRAYELYLECGCDGGHDLQHWLEAETQLSNALEAAERETPSAQRTSAGQPVPIGSRSAAAGRERA